jgi:septal ring factor EnvC (AmiA/AmiB activator)
MWSNATSSDFVTVASWSGAANGFVAPAAGPPPGIYGGRLHVPPGESAAARVLALTDQLNATKSEAEQLSARVRGLEADVDAGHKALARATSEVLETRTELSRARDDLEQWKRELAAMREKLDAADKDNLTTLQSTVGLLQQLLTQERPSADAD